ncbi:light-harvesting complex-like protein OHP2, chloroplastic isoform X2 [Macadamia integrifolia]|uniref:light-harvesting complex-like protein OHP2, chloroplastic isoform X2 n=1 Tax=Macadamia integrifolia TaxID=60698 RepID=UPI001C4E90D5|nr:light-harvesting complex-like protein OHP2, chloroplastic isoform X2 [Macadamia integrifolia]
MDFSRVSRSLYSENLGGSYPQLFVWGSLITQSFQPLLFSRQPNRNLENNKEKSRAREKKMSLASSSIPCVKISSSSCSSSTTTTCPSSSSSSSFKFSATKASITIRNSKAEGPIRRPVAPPLRQPSAPVKPVPPSPSPSPSPPSGPMEPVSVAEVSQVSDPNVITMEFQRKMAKELQEYFRQKKLEQADQGPYFGFVGKNEIANGRLDPHFG